MKISKIFIRLSLLAGGLAAFASWQGIYNSDIYKLETPNWAAQAIGQDYINLLIAVPILLISAYFVNRKSIRAIMVWFGALLYLIYSYVLYAFCIHFGPLFLIYIAILSTSFYALVGSFMQLDKDKAIAGFKDSKVKAASIFLTVVAFLFYFLWLSEILRSLVNGSLPASLVDTGLVTNPVHVLDLAFLLPGIFIIAKSLRRHQPLGLLFVIPILVFLSIMGLAIISIMFMTASDSLAALPQELMMSLIVFSSLFFTIYYLKQLKA